MTSRFATSLRGGVAACALVAASLMAAASFTPAAAAAPAAQGEVTCSGTGPCREAQTLLPLRALPRPASHVYKSESAVAEAILLENVTAFSPLFVFNRKDIDLSDPAEPKGWYQVGRTADKPEGWMQAKDVMEWRQALVVAYTHPGTGDEARNPVLMFNTADSLRKVVEAGDREARAAALYTQVEAGEKPEAVISIEPKKFTDIEDTFYVLPVLAFEKVDLFEEDTRLLQIAAAVPAKRSDGANDTTLANADYQRKSRAAPTLAEAGDMGIDIVFVMDLTGSMGKHVELTKQAILNVAQTVAADPAVKDKVRFGFVGYRDDLKVAPQLEFVSKSFTPTLIDGVAFAKLIETDVRAANISSDDYAEEVYAGMKTALEETRWTEGALRFIVQVGDASAHEPKHAQSTTGLSAAEIRQMSNDANVSVFSIHLREARAASDHPIAEPQFARLASNPGTGTPALFPVESTAQAEYERVAKQIAGQLTDVVKTAQAQAKAAAETAKAAQRAAKAIPAEQATAAGAAAAGAAVAPAEAGAAAGTASGPVAEAGTAAAKASTKAATELKDLPVEAAAASAAPAEAGVLKDLPVEAPAPAAALKDLPAEPQRLDGIAEAVGADLDQLARAEDPLSAEMKSVLGESAASPQAVADAQLINQVAAAALVNYLGGEPVRDVTFWAMDHDLVDPDKRALDVRVLVTKEELNNLITAMQQVVEAMQTAELAQLDFFTSLQSVMAQVSKGQDIDFDNARRLGSTNLLPRWIDSLPYRSAILEMNNAAFEAMVPEERVRLEQELVSKLSFYVEVNNNIDVWQALNSQSTEAAKVYPLPLAMLP